MLVASIHRTPAFAAALLSLSLAGCSASTHGTAGNESASISFGGDDNSANGSDGKTVSVDVPGFSAKIAVPGLDVGGKDTDIDGIALYPGTKLDGVNVHADAADGSGGDSQGRVDMGFSAPATPDQLLAYYKGAARQAGWSEQPPAAGQQFAATKTDGKGKPEHLAMSIAAAGAGATGHVLIDGQ